MKIANTSDYNQHINLDFKGLKKGFTAMSAEYLHAQHNAENTLDHPDKVKPVRDVIELANLKNVKVEVPAKTFVVYRLK